MQDTQFITRKLQAIRRRSVRRVLIRSLLFGASMAMLVLSVVLRIPGLTTITMIVAPALLGGLTYLVTAGLQHHRLPDLLRTAQLADGHFELAERLSSAVETSLSSEHNYLSELQKKDAGSFVNRVDAAAMVPMRPGRFPLGLLAVSAACLVLAGLVPGSPQSAPSTAGTSTETVRADGVELTEDGGRELAELMAEFDPVGHQDSTNPELEHSDGTQLPQQNEATDQAEDTVSGTGEQASDEGETTSADEFVLAEDARELPGLMPEFGDREDSWHYMEPDPDMLARLDERRQEMLSQTPDADGTVPVAAAQETPTGEGSIDGEGTDAFADPAEQTDVDFGYDSDAIMLPVADDTAGERGTAETSPDTVLSEAEGSQRFVSDNWRPSRERVVQQASIGARQQAAVEKYFLPSDPVGP